MEGTWLFDSTITAQISAYLGKLLRTKRGAIVLCDACACTEKFREDKAIDKVNYKDLPGTHLTRLECRDKQTSLARERTAFGDD